MSSMGVSFRASRPVTLMVLPSTEMISATVTPMGLGRQGLLVASTPPLGNGSVSHGMDPLPISCRAVKLEYDQQRSMYDPYLVLAGVMIALFILTVMAVFLGKYLSRRIDRNLMAGAAGGIFRS